MKQLALTLFIAVVLMLVTGVSAWSALKYIDGQQAEAQRLDGVHAQGVAVGFTMCGSH